MPCVAIEVGKDGKALVGLLPEGASAQYAQSMQPAQSLEEAMGKAQELLGAPNEEAGEPDQGAMWDQVQSDRAREAQPGGPMMGR